MKRCTSTFGILFISAVILASCQQQMSQDIEPLIIPKPASLELPGGTYTLDSESSIIFSDESLSEVAVLVKEFVSNVSALNPDIVSESGEKGISLGISEGLDTEAYELVINEEGIAIDGGSEAGVFYGLQSLIQLIHSDKPESSELIFPMIAINDQPRFEYRGIMLDVGRHYFPVDYIKKQLDLMAFYKFNRFHWHLTEDQGWRIEIKKYPKLTEIGAWRKETVIGRNSGEYDGKRYGGFYTQDEVRDIVQYASERHITIIPEIELPGHSGAALAAYPEFGCVDKEYEVVTKWGVNEDIYCPSEETFEFLQDVLTEVMDLFPGKYIHIGGDEAPKKQWEESEFAQGVIRREGLADEHELQSYFIKRIETFLNENGRSIIGWDEILEGGLAPNATVMSWRGIKGGIEAAKAGHDVIMTPTSHCYLDYYQSDDPNEPLAIGGYLPLEKVYSYEPVPQELTDEESKYVKGTQGNLWTEYISTPEKAEYMLFPRALAIAENGWSMKENKDYNDFKVRLAEHHERLKGMGVNMATHFLDVIISSSLDESGTPIVELESPDGSEIRYTINGEAPNGSSTIYDGPVAITESASIKAGAFKDGELKGRVTQYDILVHKALGRSVSWNVPPHQNYNQGGQEAFTNGKIASTDRYGDGEWLGWQGENVELTVDLGSVQALSSATTRYFSGKGAWIYPAKSLKILGSSDGSEFELLAEVDIEDDNYSGGRELTLAVEGQFQFVRFSFVAGGLIPEGMPGEGEPSWLFVDELVVN